MAQLGIGSQSGRAQTAASHAAMESAVTLVAKLRVSGQTLIDGAQGDIRALFSIGDESHTTHKLRLEVAAASGARVLDLHDGTSSTFISIPIGEGASELQADTMYRIHARVGGGGTNARHVAFYRDDGTQIVQGAAFGSALGTGAGVGFVSVGGNPGNTGRAGIPVGLIDGVAVYTSVLEGAAMWADPDAEDSGIVHYWGWKEETGSTAANEVSGSPDMTMVGTENTDWAWVAGGVWNGSAEEPSLGPATIALVSRTDAEARIEFTDYDPEASSHDIYRRQGASMDGDPEANGTRVGQDVDPEVEFVDDTVDPATQYFYSPVSRP